MSEEILKALMQLFAIIVKQDEGVDPSEIKYVQNFLIQQLSAEDVEEYLNLFYSKAGVKSDDKDDKKDKKLRLTSVKDSVRILGLCKKINRTLNQQQKVVVLVRLFELVNTNRQFSDQRMAIINTVAEVFNILKEEFANIENFVIEESAEKLDNQSILIINHKNLQCNECKHIKTEELDGDLIVLKINSVDLYFLRYTSTQNVFLNGLPIDNRRIYLFAVGSTIKLPKGKPVYYSDVVSRYMADTTTAKLSFEVKNVSFRFPTGDLGLRNITFSESNGKLIGIMGASGAGKTTLLNVLSGISSPSEGEVIINGINLHSEVEKIEGVIGYIPQDDLLIEELTVFQNLYYSAKLCFNNKTEEEITQLVNTTLISLGLFERKDLKVGSPLNKMISGGQRKRLNIALELIREPSILFVDEPTSGLSSRDSENVMDLLSELTLKGKLIFVVIHQPSSDIYKMFDKMIILDTGGYMIFQGNPVEALIYFKKIDNQINAEVGECPICGNVNPELIFNIIEARVVDEFGRYTEDRKISPPEWEEHFQQKVIPEPIDTIKEDPPTTLSIPTWFKQFRIFTVRDFLSKISNMQYVLLTMLEAPLLGFILAFIIRYSDPKSETYFFRENVNFPPYIFMSIVVALFLGLMVSAEEIFKDRKILKREQFLNLSRSSYLLSKVFILIFISAIQAILFVLIGNSILEVRGMMFYYWFALFSISVSANMLGLNISASFNSVVTIYILIPLLMIPQMVLGGAMFSFDKLNKLLNNPGKVPLIAETMPSRWIYEALMVHQFKNNEYEKIFFEYEKIDNIANFKTVYLLPELKNRIEANLEIVTEVSGDKENFEQAKTDFDIIKNELSKEKENANQRLSQIEELLKITSNSQKIRILENEKELLESTVEFTFDINNLTIKNFNESVSDNVIEYIEFLNSYYSQVWNIAHTRIETIKQLLNEKDPKLIKIKQQKYHNEALAEIVKNILEKNPIVAHDGVLIQQKDPVYLDPDDSGIRTHFYAPRKYFMGKYFDTFWFNVVIVWLISMFFYITLYYDLLKRMLELFAKIDLKKTLGKIKTKK